MTEPKAALLWSLWAVEKSPGLLERRWGHSEVISSHPEGEFLGIGACQEENFFTLQVACSKKNHPEYLSFPQVLSFLFGTMKPGCPGRLGKCVLFSWLCASPDCSCSGPRQLQVTHCLSLVPADSLPWTCLKLNHSLRQGLLFPTIIPST